MLVHSSATGRGVGLPTVQPGVVDLVELMHRQCGVLAAGQLNRLGLRETGRWRVEDGQWQQPYRSVLVTHNGPLTREQRLWAALLAAPPGAALAGVTALELAGLRWSGLDRELHMSIPAGRRRPGIPGVRVHWSGDLGSEAVHPSATPPRTRTARSAVDSASWASGDWTARALLLAAVQQRLCTPSALTDALARRGTCKRHALVAETIRDAEGGIQSVPEREFAVLVRRSRLPEPTRQRLLQRSNGRYYLDADWREFGFCAEVQGSPHQEFVAWDQDLDRQNEVSAGGRRVLQFTSYAVRHRRDRVTDLLRRSLHTGGWSGRVRRG